MRVPIPSPRVTQQNARAILARSQRVSPGLPPEQTEADEVRAPGFARFSAEADPVEGAETILCEAPGAYGRCDVHVSASNDWTKSGVRVRAYARTWSGLSLLIDELWTALALPVNSGERAGRVLSLESAGSLGYVVSVFVPNVTGVPMGRARVVMYCAPGGGSTGQLAAPLGQAAGHADRAEHIRGAAMLARLAADGRFYAQALAPVGLAPLGFAPLVASLADPAPDYLELNAPAILGTVGRALRNASGAVCTVTVLTPSGLAVPKTISNIQPGEVVPVRVNEITASTAWPIGILEET